MLTYNRSLGQFGIKHREATLTVTWTVQVISGSWGIE